MSGAQHTSECSESNLRPSRGGSRTTGEPLSSGGVRIAARQHRAPAPRPALFAVFLWVIDGGLGQIHQLPAPAVALQPSSQTASRFLNWGTRRLEARLADPPHDGPPA